MRFNEVRGKLWKHQLLLNRQICIGLALTRIVTVRLGELDLDDLSQQLTTQVLVVNEKG